MNAKFIAHLTVAGILFCGITCPAPCAGKDEQSGGSFELPAWVFDRGNADVRKNPYTYVDYRDINADIIVTDGGQTPWVVEYDIDFPVDAAYTLHVRYVADEPRPVEFWLDGNQAGTCCTNITRTPTGITHNPYYEQTDWLPRILGPKWEKAAEFKIAKGRHTLKFTCEGKPPDLVGLRFVSSNSFPKGWLPTGPGIQLPKDRQDLINRMFHVRKRPWQPIGQLEKIDRLPPIYRTMFLPPDSVNTETLRLAISDMISRFGERYPEGPEYLDRLNRLTEQRSMAYRKSPAFDHNIETALADLRREAMLKHPLLDFDKLVFVKRYPCGSGHIYTDHKQRTMGGALCVLSPVAPDGKVTELAPQLKGGLFGRFDISFDARKIVFGYKKSPDDGFRIYEIGVDGAGLRQITFDCPEEECKWQYHKFQDCDPCYLPDGKILFTSTRSERHVLCFGSSVTTLYVMDADGSNMHCVSAGPITEMSPSVMNDGRVVYTRWEYIDKPLGNVQSLWAVRPDGSHSTHIYKNDVYLPAGLINARSIPGSTRLVAVGAPHCGPSVGPLVLIDNRLNRRNGAALTSITPEVGLSGMFNQKIAKEYGYFKSPFPLSERFFLVAHTSPSFPSLHPPEVLANTNATVRTLDDNPRGYGLYVIDAWGNRTELYRDPEINCSQPMPLRPRQLPAEIVKINSHDAEEQKPGTIFMQDIYKGMTGIKRGRVKYLRVMEAVGVSWADATRAHQYGDASWGQRAIVSDGIDIHRKKILGVATVHEDGSALFNVPANKNLFFQALDENYMELQRMRTFVNLVPGEKRSCIGCHERRQLAPSLSLSGMPGAMRQAPETLRPQPGDTEPRFVHYPSDVIPILEKRCVSCHGKVDPAGDLDLTAERTKHFDTSYDTLLKKKLVAHILTTVSLPPLTFGSHQSRLVRRIQKAPCKSDLTREEFIRIVTWVDSDASYYGTHQGRKNIKWKDEPDFRPLPDDEEHDNDIHPKVVQSAR